MKLRIEQISSGSAADGKLIVPDGSGGWKTIDVPTGSGTPATTVTDETTWGITPAVGTSTNYARADHTHGTPTEPSGGTGDVVGPASAADGHLAVFDGATGKLIKDGGAVPSGSITVKEVDGTPSVANVTTITVTNGTLTDDGAGAVTLDFGSAATDGAAIHDNVANEISTITEKTTLADNDLFVIEDSAASYAKKKVKKSNLGGGITYGTSTKSVGKAYTSSTSSTFIRLVGRVIIYRPIKLASVLWNIKSPGDYTLTIRNPDDDSVIATSNTVTNTVAHAQETFTITDGPVMLQPGLYLFQMLISGSTNVTWDDARSGQPHNFSAFSLDGGTYYTYAGAASTDYSAPAVLVFYDSQQ